MNRLLGIFGAIFVLLLGMLLGNFMGDQATIRSCATNGEASMIGGGAISCAAKEDAP